MADDLRKHLVGVTPRGDGREVRHPFRTPDDSNSNRTTRTGTDTGTGTGTDTGTPRATTDADTNLATASIPSVIEVSAPAADPRPTPAGALRAALAVVDTAVDAARSAAENLAADPRSTALSQVLADLPAGPGLAALLHALDPDAVSDADVVDLVAAGVRVESWAHARTTQAAAALARRASMNPIWSEQAGGPPPVACVAGDELAMRLGWSRRAATRLVRHGQAYDGALFPTGDALAAGVLDPVKAAIITDRLIDEPGEIALMVQDAVLDRAPRRAPTQLTSDLTKALIAVDPVEAARRHTRARATRRVERPRMLLDGMAGLWSVLPAETAVRIHTALDAAARTARNAGDPRTLDQLRADGLADLVLHTACPASGQGTDPAGSSTGAGEPPGTTDATPTDVGRRAPDARHVAAAPDARHVAAAPDAGQEAAAPDAGQQAAAPDAGREAAAPGDDQDAAAAAHESCRHRAPRTQVMVTVALSTLIGLDDHPADLAGYGPIDATAARALAEGGIWRRVVTDPLSGTVLDVGRTRYRPPAGLVEHVQTRDRTCARPGCSTPATACDLDHTIEYHAPPATRSVSGTGGGRQDIRDPRGTGDAQDIRDALDARDVGLGTTSHDNLEPLCRRDHRLKTDGGYVLRQRDPGVFEWTSPTGHRYLVQPGDDGASAHLGCPATGRRTRAASVLTNRGPGGSEFPGRVVGAGRPRAELPGLPQVRLAAGGRPWAGRVASVHGVRPPGQGDVPSRRGTARPRRGCPSRRGCPPRAGPRSSPWARARGVRRRAGVSLRCRRGRSPRPRWRSP